MPCSLIEAAGQRRMPGFGHPHAVPMYERRWPIQFESKGTSQTSDVIVLVDHCSLWERA
jgi:hypothetical protein